MDDGRTAIHPTGKFGTAGPVANELAVRCGAVRCGHAYPECLPCWRTQEACSRGWWAAFLESRLTLFPLSPSDVESRGGNLSRFLRGVRRAPCDGIFVTRYLLQECRQGLVKDRESCQAYRAREDARRYG